MSDQPAQPKKPFLYVVVCASGIASDVHKLITAAQKQGWDLGVIATPLGLGFIDASAVEAQTGYPIRSAWRSPGDPRPLPPADAIAVAPATFNTINKWAAGICDTYALGLLAEAPGLRIPTVVLPFVNSALAGRRAFRHSVDELRHEGVRVLLGPGEFEPHPPGTGGDHLRDYPWHLALAEAERMSRQ